MPLPPGQMGGLAGAMMPAGNAISTMLPQRGGMPQGGMPQGGGQGGVPPEVQQGIMEILAAIQRDPENAAMYIDMARQRYGIDLQEIAAGGM